VDYALYMLADRIRAFGIVSASILGIVTSMFVITDADAIAARVTVATSETIDTPVQEVQYVTPPDRRRDVICRYPVSRMAK
jgi:NhaP-type Na+/H+ or K+/H+ antiporter